MHMERFPPHDMAKLWEVAAQHANREEHFQMRHDMEREAQCQDTFKGDQKCRFNQGKNDGLSFQKAHEMRELCKMRPHQPAFRYDQYTPLLCNQVEALQKISKGEIAVTLLKPPL